MTEDNTPLSEEEKDLFRKCEITIQQSIYQFRELSIALHTIQERRLYRTSYSTYEGYVRSKWSDIIGLFTKQHIYRLAAAGEVLVNLQENDIPTLPANEAQARALSQYPKEEQPQIWQETLAATNGKPTALAIQQTAASKFNSTTFFDEQSPSETIQDDAVQSSETQQRREQAFTPTVTTRATKPAMKALVAYYLDGDRENKRGGNEVWVKPETRHCLEDSRSRVQRKLLESGSIGFDIRVGFYVAGENVEDLLNDL